MKQALLPEAPSPGPGSVEAWAIANQYYPLVGVDEAGRGCLAGPVAAAAVLLPPGCVIPGLDDSKTIPEPMREKLYDDVTAAAIGWAVAMGSTETIATTNILAATLEAMGSAVHEAVRMAGVTPRMVVVDGNRRIPGLEWPQTPWVKGDHLSLNCAAASILAKVTRDRLMRDLDRDFPGYGFAVHKGYGVPAHMEALARLGPCPIHRRTFRPVRELLEGRECADSATDRQVQTNLDI